MDLGDLAIFVDVMRCGTFAAVARERGVAPSSVSRSIAALERSLGARLFRRTTRKLAPTEAAIAYFERATPLLDELERAGQLAQGGVEALRGPLRVTAPPGFAQRNLTPLLPEFARQHPGLSFELLLTDKFLDLVEDRVDVAVRLARLADSALVAARLCEVAHAVCASPAYLRRRGRPRSPADLGRHECLRHPVPGHAARWHFRPAGGGEAVEVPAHGRVIASSGEALRQCAVAGMGVVLLPRWGVARDLAEGALVQLLPGYEATPAEFDVAAWALYPSARYVPRKVRTFVDFLKRKFRHGAPAELGLWAGAAGDAPLAPRGRRRALSPPAAGDAPSAAAGASLSGAARRPRGCWCSNTRACRAGPSAARARRRRLRGRSGARTRRSAPGCAGYRTRRST